MQWQMMDVTAVENFGGTDILLWEQTAFLEVRLLPRMNDPPGNPNSLNLSFLENLYRDYLQKPEALSEEWRAYFSQIQNGEPNPPAEGPRFQPRTIFNPDGAGGTPIDFRAEPSFAEKQD